jgi:outer membrane lipoprotein-sorting protein
VRRVAFGLMPYSLMGSHKPRRPLGLARLGFVLGVGWALALGFALPSAALADPPAPSPADRSPQVAQAVAALRAISTLQAQFVQIDNDGQRAKGVLTLKRPGKIRFQYAPGTPLLVVSDGHALTILDTEVNQMQRWPIANSPLGALLNPARDVVQFGRLVPSADPRVLAIEVKDRQHPEFGVLTLFMAHKPAAPGGLELLGWQALDSQGRMTRTVLSEQRYGLPASDELFRFIDPRARPHK